MKKTILFFGIAVGLHTLGAFAYDLGTHENISTRSVKESVLTKGKVLEKLGLKPLGSGQTFPDFLGEPYRIDQLIARGARHEDTDELMRVFHHFYNPATGQPLTVGGALGSTSPDWALEDREQLTSIHSGEQRFSYRDARWYFLQALIAPTPAGRDENWGLAFQSLGHVIHHIQDMAQPQHVRNDPHCGPYCGNVYPASAYEAWTEENRRELPLDPVVAGYDVSSERYRNVFDRPRAFWHTHPPEHLAAGQGMAEFTHRNFVSAGTLFKPEFALPVFDITKSIDLDIQHLAPGTPLNGVVRFFANDVRDEFLNVTQTNAAGLSESVFDAELLKARRQPVFSLNRFTFQAAQGFLMPRAVAHSAGLINYFFRTDFEMVRDSEDASTFRIRNRTSEPMNGKIALYVESAAGERWRVNGQEWNVEIPAEGDSAVLGKYPSYEKFMMVFEGSLGAEKPANGSLGAIGAQRISRCRVGPYEGGFSHDILDRTTGRRWDGKNVFLAEGGMQPRERNWGVAFGRHFFTARIQPMVTTVVFAIPRANAPAELVTFVERRPDEPEDTTQYFVLPAAMSDSTGWPRMEEDC